MALAREGMRTPARSWPQRAPGGKEPRPKVRKLPQFQGWRGCLECTFCGCPLRVGHFAACFSFDSQQTPCQLSIDTCILELKKN